MKRRKRKLDLNKIGFAISFIVVTAMLIHKIATEGLWFFTVIY